MGDDGKGLNVSRLYDKGIDNNLWQEQDKPALSTVADLIFMSGVSTKEQVSDISGRGVGMDAVKQFLLQHECDIQLRLLDEKVDENGFVAFETLVTLPSALFCPVYTSDAADELHFYVICGSEIRTKKSSTTRSISGPATPLQ